MTEAEREIIKHSLGLTRSNVTYRNYFCADPDHADMPLIRSLIASGHMRASHTINGGRDTIYVVTEVGRAAVGAAG
jgi:hypothetical protein